MYKIRNCRHEAVCRCYYYFPFFVAAVMILNKDERRATHARQESSAYQLNGRGVGSIACCYYRRKRGETIGNAECFWYNTFPDLGGVVIDYKFESKSLSNSHLHPGYKNYQVLTWAQPLNRTLRLQTRRDVDGTGYCRSVGAALNSIITLPGNYSKQATLVWLVVVLRGRILATIFEFCMQGKKTPGCGVP